MVIILNILLAVVIGVPIFRALRLWEEWVKQSSMLVRPFTWTKRFGWRSWASRGFVLNTSPEDVVAKINLLPEKDWTTNQSNTTIGDSDMAALAPMLGKTKFETGIKVEWIDDKTVELRAWQHADWPVLREDVKHLPLRQRQRLAEHVILHVEPDGSGKTRVGYEVELPAWVLVAAAATLLLMGWIARMTVVLHLIPLLLNLVFISLFAVWFGRILKLQNISLLDNLVSTFGPISAE